MLIINKAEGRLLDLRPSSPSLHPSLYIPGLLISFGPHRCIPTHHNYWGVMCGDVLAFADNVIELDHYPAVNAYVKSGSCDILQVRAPESMVLVKQQCHINTNDTPRRMVLLSSN